MPKMRRGDSLSLFTTSTFGRTGAGTELISSVRAT